MKKSHLFATLAALSVVAYSGTAFGQTGSNATGNWSDSGTWNNGLPVNGAAVGILNGNTVTYQTGDAYTGGGWTLGLLIGSDAWAFTNWGITGDGEGTLNVVGGTLNTGYLGMGMNKKGTLNISGGNVTAGNEFVIGWNGVTGSSINVSGGTLNLTGTADYYNLGHADAATLDISGGAVNLSRSLAVKNGSSINLSSGSLSCGAGSNLQLAFGSGTGTINQSGGTATFAANESLWLGNAIGQDATYNLSGGTWTQNGYMRMGVWASGHGVINQTGGTFELNNGIEIWASEASNYNLQGGVFKLGLTNPFHDYSGGLYMNVTGTSGNVTLDTQSYDIDVASLSVTNLFDNAAATLTKTGSGRFHFAGLRNFQMNNGTLDMQAGTFETDGVFTIGASAGTAVANLSGGTIRYGVPTPANFVVGNGATGTINQTGGSIESPSQNYALGWSGTGTHTMTAGSVNTGTGTAFVGLGAGGVGTLNLDGGTFTAGAMLISYGATSGLVNVNGGSLTVNGGLEVWNNGTLAVQNGTVETSSTISVGVYGSTAANATVSGGTLKTGYLAASNLVVGNGGTGTAMQTAGAVDIGGLANVAFGWSGTGTYTMNGGTFNAAGNTYVGLFGGGVGTLNINGGSFTANGLEISAGGATSGTVNLAGGTLSVTGGLSIQPGGVVNVNTGGNLTTSNSVTITAGGTLKLGGGTISVLGSISGMGDIANSGTYDVNGQTVAAGSCNANYFAGPNAKLTNSSASAATILGWTGSVMSNTVWIPSSGAIIETVGDLTIDSLVLDGGTNHGFTKTGNGTLFLTSSGNNYNGETIINAGTLSMSNPTLSDTATVRIDGGALNLNFSGEDQVDKAYAKLGGFLLVRLGPGQYGANDGVGITGPGYLRIAQGYESWAADLAADSPPLADTTRTGDPDNDGLSNAVEYALGLDPRYSNGSPGVASNGGKTITFTKGSEAKYNDKVTYQIEASTTLGAAPSPWTVDVTNVTDDTDTISITFPDGPVKNFARLKVILAP